MEDNKFFCGNLTKSEAESLLLAKKHERFVHGDGGFLIRNTDSTPGDFTLSVKYGDSVQHFKVWRDREDRYFLWVVKFNSLNDMIEYHRTSSISRSQLIFLKDQLKWVKAIYDFDPQEADELAFKCGDEICVRDVGDPNWWRGECNGKTGMFPATYVKEITDQ